MKKLFAIFVLLTVVWVQNTDAHRYRYRDVNINYFYYELSPYGDWMQIEGGMLVWKPIFTSYDWMPYSDGRWIWTDYGWYWDSYEPFGFITYHYGRWFYDEYYGWVWMPDYEWAPAWVEWRYNDVYVGWAPLPPYAEFRANVGIHFTVRWRSPFSHWRFVSYGRFCAPNVHNYFVNQRYVEGFFRTTKYRNAYERRKGRIINYGIDRRIVERRSGSRIRSRSLNFTSNRNSLVSRSNSRDVIRVYEPDSKTVSRYGSIKKEKIKRAGKSSLKVDKVVVKRNNEYKNSGDYKVKRSGNSIRKNYSPDRIYKKGKQNASELNKSERKKKVKSKVVQSDRFNNFKKGERRGIESGRKKTYKNYGNTKRNKRTESINSAKKKNKVSIRKSIRRSDPGNKNLSKSRRLSSGKREKSNNKKNRNGRN